MMVIDTVGSFYIIFFASEDPVALLCSSQIDQKKQIIDFLFAVAYYSSSSRSSNYQTRSQQDSLGRAISFRSSW